MKKEAQLLLAKSVNSLILSIEMFNRPSEQGRTEAVLIFIDHAFEMLLKASILHRNGAIREAGARNTIGFESCLRRALSDKHIRFLSTEQVLALQSINSLRDAAQHHLLDISEPHLYLHTQTGVTIYRTLYKEVFNKELLHVVPNRVLPISTFPSQDLCALFEREVETIKILLQPGTRRGIQVLSKLRALAIVEGAMNGEKLQPSEGQLRKYAHDIQQGKQWDTMFPGVARLEITTLGHGPSIDLRISKADGLPVTLVPEGTPGASVVAVKRVNELDYYNLSRDKVASLCGLSGPKATAVVRYLNLQSDIECFKEIIVDKVHFGRYSQKAVARIKETLITVNIVDIWKSHGIKGKNKDTNP